MPSATLTTFVLSHTNWTASFGRKVISPVQINKWIINYYSALFILLSACLSTDHDCSMQPDSSVNSHLLYIFLFCSFRNLLLGFGFNRLSLVSNTTTVCLLESLLNSHARGMVTQALVCIKPNERKTRKHFIFVDSILCTFDAMHIIHIWTTFMC